MRNNGKVGVGCAGPHVVAMVRLLRQKACV